MWSFFQSRRTATRTRPHVRDCRPTSVRRVPCRAQRCGDLNNGRDNGYVWMDLLLQHAYHASGQQASSGLRLTTPVTQRQSSPSCLTQRNISLPVRFLAQVTVQMAALQAQSARGGTRQSMDLTAYYRDHSPPKGGNIWDEGDGQGERQPGPMTRKTLAAEAALFVGGVLLMTTLALAFRLFLQFHSSDPFAWFNATRAFAMICKTIYVYLVFRFARVLQLPWWLTVVYCVLAPFALLYVIPFIGLLIKAWRVRRTLIGQSQVMP